MTDVDALRYWLLRTPKPTTLRVLDAKGAESLIQCKPYAPAKNVSWQALATSVCALGPVSVHALDPKGEVLRAVLTSDLVSEEDEPDEETTTVQTDAMSATLVVLAKLLAEAYRHSNEVAFEKLVALFDAVNQRGAQMERSLDAMYKLTLKNIEAQATAQAADGNNGSLLEQILAAFVQGQQDKAAHVVNGAANGAPPKGDGTP